MGCFVCMPLHRGRDPLSQYAGHNTAYLGMFVLSRHAALLLAA